MDSYRFFTRISEQGTIQLPNTPILFDREVEIIIYPKGKRSNQKSGAKNFVEKWAGFLSDENIEKAKLKHLYKNYP